ncbi:RNA polymerase sigma factor [Paenibacillus hodogayensis]|uniref:RNA polymerase sigma factor n=1 Tax=Paenibacillus hodogayensis TaxID=279208 RepID=A0ABV5VQ84_9BACL
MDFEELLACISEGRYDGEAVAQFGQEWLPGIVRHLAGREARLRNRRLRQDDYADIAAKVLEIVLLRCRPGLGEGRALRAWVCQVVQNVARNKLRERHPVPIPPGTAQDWLDRTNSDPAGQPFDAGQLEILEEAIRALPHNQRQAIIWRYWRGCSAMETARHMHCSPNQVDQWAHKARTTLARTLEPYFPRDGARLAQHASEGDGAREAAMRLARNGADTLRESRGLYAPDLAVRFDAAEFAEGMKPACHTVEPLVMDSFLLMRFAWEDAVLRLTEASLLARMMPGRLSRLLAGELHLWELADEERSLLLRTLNVRDTALTAALSADWRVFTAAWPTPYHNVERKDAFVRGIL